MATRNYTLFPHMWTVRRISQSYGQRKYSVETLLHFYPTKEDAKKAIKSWIDPVLIKYKSAITYKTEDGYTCVDIRSLSRRTKYKVVLIHTYNIIPSKD